MAQITADRVKETSTTTGTGSYSLAGAVSGFRAFSAVCANTDTVYYAAVGGTDWEVGLGTWATGNTLARTTILASSNSGAAVDWIAGTRDVFLTHPARAATVNVQEFGGPSTSGTSTWTKPAGAKLVHIIAQGSGNGGGCGGRRATGNTSAINSGSGGNGGSRVEIWLSASSLGATETITVGAGGAGTAGRTTDGGNLGGSGGSSTTVGSFLTCFSGNFQGNDFGFSGTSLTGAGGAISSVAGSNGTPGLGGGGGGSGGGIDTASPPSRAGGLAGLGSAWKSAGGTVTGSGGTGNGGAGGAGASPSDNWFSGNGGGGGGNGVTANAGAGGAGGWPGGGGGGGGASVNPYNSGAGGNGANGFVRITTYF
jgi:hypothetical protein